MKEYRVSIRVRNNRILERIEQAGYSSVADFCRQNGLSHVEIGEFISMKRSPLYLYREWKESVLKMCDALFCFPADLFTDAQRELRLKQNVAEAYFAEDDLQRIGNAENMIQYAQLQIATDKVMQTLTPREQFVIKNRFGMENGQEKTIEEIGRIMGFTNGYIRVVEGKALRKLRLPRRSKILKPFKSEMSE